MEKNVHTRRDRRHPFFDCSCGRHFYRFIHRGQPVRTPANGGGAFRSISIPVYFALYAALRKTNKPYALLALIIFLLGTAIFVSNNTALPMLELSRKYALADETQKSLLAAAGEAMLVRG